jgi:hypothetical protein
MINEQLYRKTVDILFQAYFNDTLKHDDCSACAVGNMVAANMGITTQQLTPRIHLRQGWNRVFTTFTSTRQFINPKGYVPGSEAKTQIDSTGYCWQDLAKIEFAFETAPKGESDEDWMFNGLVAVLDVLKDIHQVEDNTADVEMFVNQKNVRCHA